MVPILWDKRNVPYKMGDWYKHSTGGRMHNNTQQKTRIAQQEAVKSFRIVAEDLLHSKKLLNVFASWQRTFQLSLDHTRGFTHKSVHARTRAHVREHRNPVH